MSQTLVPCARCSRHVRASDHACPFCAAPLDAPTVAAPSTGQATRVVVALAAALTASASLAACYGGPPRPQTFDAHQQSSPADGGGAAGPSGH